MKLSALIKYVFCAIGHPILFFIFLFVFTEENPGKSSAMFFGQPLFFKLSTNVYRINSVSYVLYALIFYGIWLGFQFWFLHQFRQFSFEAFITKKFTPFYLILCGLGYINLIFWIIYGMEGNVFGFVFALPLMILSLLVGFMELKVFFARRV